jgi:Flp pilus assembly protein CpaB
VATEVKQRNNRVLVIVGAVLAVAAFGAAFYVSQRNGGSGTASTGGGGSNASLVTAVVATADIPKDTKITADQLAPKQLPADQVPVGSPTDPSTLVGKFVSVDVKANQVVQTSWLFADVNTATAAVALTPPLDIHQGFVALAMPVSGQGPQFTEDAFLVGGFIHDDDHIDIIIDAGNGVTRYALQDIRVLHVGNSSAAPNSVPTVLVVEVNRSQAELLTYLTTNRGPQTVLRYVLRATKDFGQTTGSNYVNSTDPGIKPITDPPVTADSFGKLFPAK